MEEIEKSPESCFTGDLRSLMELHDGENGGEFLPEVEIKEEMVVEVMQELLKEINTCCCEVETSPSPASFPATMSSSSFVVGGDNERCGPAFSDSASTVMAGVGMGPTKVLAGEEVGFPAGGGEGKMDGCDDDEWLERVLSMDLKEFEDWT